VIEKLMLVADLGARRCSPALAWCGHWTVTS